jgi:hypothetical protein
VVEWRRPGDGDDALAVVLARSGLMLGSRCRVYECMYGGGGKKNVSMLCNVRLSGQPEGK